MRMPYRSLAGLTMTRRRNGMLRTLTWWHAKLSRKESTAYRLTSGCAPMPARSNQSSSDAEGGHQESQRTLSLTGLVAREIVRLEGRIVYGRKSQCQGLAFRNGRKPGGKKKATRATRGLDVPPITGEMKEGASTVSSADISSSKFSFGSRGSLRSCRLGPRR